MGLADNIRYLRRKNNLSQEFISEKLGYKSYTTIQKWETGVSEPSLKKLHDLSKIFNVDVDDLVSKDLTVPEVEVIGKAKPMKPYRYIADPISAGNPENIDGQNYGQIYIPSNLMGKYENNPNVTIMRVNGDSMNKIIPHNSTIGILENISACDLHNGDIVVFNDNNNDYSVKRFFKSGSKIIFRPESTEEVFTDIVYDTEYESVRIIGKVIMYSVVL